MIHAFSWYKWNRMSKSLNLRKKHGFYSCLLYKYVFWISFMSCKKNVPDLRVSLNGALESCRKSTGGRKHVVMEEFVTFRAPENRNYSKHFLMLQIPLKIKKKVEIDRVWNFCAVCWDWSGYFCNLTWESWQLWVTMWAVKVKISNKTTIDTKGGNARDQRRTKSLSPSSARFSVLMRIKFYFSIFYCQEGCTGCGWDGVKCSS